MDTVGIVDGILKHYGVKGMHWGVRKVRERKARRGQRIAETISDDARRAGEAFAKKKRTGIHSLSNQELRLMVDRMNLEQQYSRLAPPSSLQRIVGGGARFAGRIIADVGAKQASRLLNDYATRQIAAAMGSRN